MRSLDYGKTNPRVLRARDRGPRDLRGGGRSFACRCPDAHPQRGLLRRASRGLAPTGRIPLAGIPSGEITPSGEPGSVEYVGEVRLKPMPETMGSAVRGKIVLEGEIQPTGVAARLSFVVPFNTHRTDGRHYSDYVDVKVSSSVEFSASGLSPTDYSVYITAPGYVGQHRSLSPEARRDSRCGYDHAGATQASRSLLPRGVPSPFTKAQPGAANRARRRPVRCELARFAEILSIWSSRRTTARSASLPLFMRARSPTWVLARSRISSESTQPRRSSPTPVTSCRNPVTFTCWITRTPGITGCCSSSSSMRRHPGTGPKLRKSTARTKLEKTRTKLVGQKAAPLDVEAWVNGSPFTDT